MDWNSADDGKWKRKDPIEVMASEDGSGVGAALIAALTLKRVQEGNMAGIRDEKALKDIGEEKRREAEALKKN